MFWISSIPKCIVVIGRFSFANFLLEPKVVKNSSAKMFVIAIRRTNKNL